MTTTLSTALPTDLHPVLDAYRTCELATIAKDATPIAWPIMAVHDPATDRFTITTCIGLPAKAFNVRHDERVSLLFSEPRGSGLDQPPRVLVQGTATCPDEIVTAPDDRLDYWRTLYARQPAGALYGSNAVLRRFFDWYYMRLVISVTPQRITVDDPPDVPAAPPVPKVAPRIPGDLSPLTAAEMMQYTAFGEAQRRLRRYPSVVLTTLDPDGFPRSARVRLSASTGRFLLPDSLEVEEGRASLLAHRHDEHTWGLSSVAVVGDVRRRDGRLGFDVRRVIPGASQNPVTLVAMMREARATAGRYLDRRGLQRPTVPWQAYALLAHPRRS